MKRERLRYQREEVAFYTRKWQVPTADRYWVKIHPTTFFEMKKLWAKYFGKSVRKVLK